jgi:hypothetical protein
MNDEVRMTTIHATVSVPFQILPAAPEPGKGGPFGFPSSFVIGHSSFGLARDFTQIWASRWIHVPLQRR